jgi:nucleoside-diphosphate-sugar epimerase
MSELPLVITGASGFIGKHVVLAQWRHRPLFCIARRFGQESNIPADPNITWITVDIAKQVRMQEVTEYILQHGGAGYVLHLAGYYDFDNQEHPAYEATNVRGTENMLKLARALQVRRFIFSSSLAASSFTPAGSSLTEDSSPDADIPYGRSKKQAEAPQADCEAALVSHRKYEHVSEQLEDAQRGHAAAGGGAGEHFDL